MIIRRVLNTNAVLTVDSSGKEVVLLGAGIGFKEKPGFPVDESKIEKKFIPNDEKKLDRFVQMLSEIPEEQVLAAEEIISFAETVISQKLNESIHISLPEHINMSIDNHKDGISIPCTILMEIRQFYNTEYQLGLKGLEIIKTKTGYELSENEAGFIAMHIINAETDSDNKNTRNIIKLVNELNELITERLDIVFDKDSNSYYRYMTHLKFFADRIINHQMIDVENFEQFDFLSEKYKKEYECSRYVIEYIENRYNYKVNSDENVYLTIHLANISRERK